MSVWRSCEAVRKNLLSTHVLQGQSVLLDIGIKAFGFNGLLTLLFL